VTLAAPAPPFAVAPAGESDIAELIVLWQRCGLTRPWNADVALARERPNAAVLVGRDDRGIVASVVVGHDGHRGWVYYVAGDPDCRHRLRPHRYECSGIQAAWARH